MRRLLDAFGPDHFRVELQRPFQRHDRALNRGLANLAARLNVPTVATGDVHAHSRARAQLQDAFVAVRLHTTLDASEPERRGNHSHVLATPAAMAARFSRPPGGACRRPSELAERLTFDLTADLGYRYPGSEDETANRTLAELCTHLLEDRYAGTPRHAEAKARLEQELQVIATLGLPGFFLLHRDMLELAREVAIEVRGNSAARALLPPGRGRGSSVSSIVCYLTGLSHIDPIANELFLGRFLNEELTSLPDIDLDFPRDIREVLIPRVHERYGREHSALVAAFPTYRARGAIRELGKALGLPPARSNASPAAPRAGRRARSTATSHPRWASERQTGPLGLARQTGRRGPRPPAPSLPALRRHDRLHPPAPRLLPGRPRRHGGPPDLPVGQGLLRRRRLPEDRPARPRDALRRRALRRPHRAHRNEQIDLSRIPYDDPPTYEMIQTAETMGVFQIESRAQMQSLLRTRPETLDDITIQVAIVRPGPIQGGAVNPYIERRQRLREDPSYEVPYEHPSLEPVLRDTLGTIIFQDQVLEVAIAFAGFSTGEAEGLRRAMSRKRSEAAIRAHHDRFIAGAIKTHGVSEDSAERVWQMIQGFSGFGFPKAHGAAFGLLAYQSTWLRVHYVQEFLCALLNEQPMGFYPPDPLAHEAQRRGIELRAAEVNASEAECTVEDERRSASASAT